MHKIASELGPVSGRGRRSWLRLALIVTLSLLALSAAGACEDDPRDLDYLQDAGQ